MKKVEIVSHCFIPTDKEGQMKCAYTGSVLSLDDDVAGALVAAQRARWADPDARNVDTTRQHEAQAGKAAAAEPAAA